jgi:hypothetical protein
MFQTMFAFMNKGTRAKSLWMIGASVAHTGMSVSINLAAGQGVPISHILLYRGAYRGGDLQRIHCND